MVDNNSYSYQKVDGSDSRCAIDLGRCFGDLWAVYCQSHDVETVVHVQDGARDGRRQGGHQKCSRVTDILCSEIDVGQRTLYSQIEAILRQGQRDQRVTVRKRGRTSTEM